MTGAGIPKPFHRNVRELAPGPNSGYSGWAYITDRRYAKDALHNIRAFLLIQDDLLRIFDFIEPSDLCLTAYSFRTQALLNRTCMEIEANFRTILSENKFTPPSERHLNMSDFGRVDVTHHL
jgi:hypothetical protein